MSNINCPNKNKAIASFITNASDPARSSWDLTPYKTAGIGKPGGTWRLIETGANLMYYSGVVATDGTLASSSYQSPAAGVAATRQTRESTESGLPDEFVSHYSYDGYMELQIDDPPPKCTTCPCPEEEE